MAAATAFTLTALGLLIVSPASAETPLTSGGTATSGAPRVVADASALDSGPQILAPSSDTPPTLDRSGKPTGQSLPAQANSGTKPVPTTLSGPPPAGSANSGSPAPTPAPLAPTGIAANFNGVAQGGSNCGGCQPPDINAAMSGNQIVEAVNLRVQVYNRTGTTVCGFSLNTFLGTSNSLSDPRVQWDNLAKRYTLVAIPIPGPTSTPAMFIAASQTSNACGGWVVYRPTFTGGLFAAGTLLDYPYIGQDRVALLSSSNNFVGNTYRNSTAFSVPKSALYSGAGFSVPVFQVAFSTAPVQVAGSPMPSTTNTFFLASVPGFGYSLYRMNHSAGPGTTMTLQANIASTFSAPPRRVKQPGTTQTLDPLDGRIVWSPFQDGARVWFAHGIAIGSFPGVRYGAINTATNSAQVAQAFRGSSSDDFNPSISVGPPVPGTNSVNIFVNWAYTDTPNGVPTSATVDSVLPGGGVPNLIGTSLILRRGSSTSSNFRFGDYSSVQIDQASPCKALVAQQVFGSTGQWNTRLARVGQC